MALPNPKTAELYYEGLERLEKTQRRASALGADLRRSKAGTRRHAYLERELELCDARMEDCRTLVAILADDVQAYFAELPPEGAAAIAEFTVRLSKRAS